MHWRSSEVVPEISLPPCKCFVVGTFVQVQALHTATKIPSIYSFSGIAGLQSQFPHSCVCERFIYSQDRFTHFLQQNRQINRGNISIAHRHMNAEIGPVAPHPQFLFWEYLFQNFRYCFFAVHLQITSC
jgi:hypothetical protein